MTFDTRDPAARQAGIAAAVAALRNGELVAMPTETVYGLAADATSGTAVAGIFAAKGRPRFNPLIVHLPSAEAAEAIATFTPLARRLAEAFWPGPLTLVLRKRSDAPVADLTTAGLDTIALRVPAHPIARELLAAFAKPLAAPSANLSGHVSSTNAAHVAADLGDKVAVVLDAGPSSIGLESTIVGLAGPTPVLLRHGAISREEIEGVTGVAPVTSADAAAAPAAPGMLASHYAPSAILRLNATEASAGEALLAFGALPPNAHSAVAIANLSERSDLTEAAANLFAALRTLDAAAKAIAVMRIPDEGLGIAINDRLRRAAAPRG